MEFKENQAIYLQIADLMCENILAGICRRCSRLWTCCIWISAT
jgi:DNA-binding transcriptional regulator YhcF (GntR family)